MNSIPVAVPPPPDQRRIVAKVGALRKLCDDLEAKVTGQEATAGRLVEAVVKGTLAPTPRLGMDAQD